MNEPKNSQTDALPSRSCRNIGELKVEIVSIKSLICDPSNARTHSNTDIASLSAIIGKFGWTNPILVRPDGRIIAGHARLEAARSLGLTEVPVIRISGLTEAQYRAVAIADNKLALSAGWDEDRLRVELARLRKEDFDLKLTGFDEEELDRLLLELKEADIPIDPDSVPPIPQTAVTVPGDLWLLGEHRLLCGDAIDMQAVQRILNCGPTDMVFTDLPDSLSFEVNAPPTRGADKGSFDDKFRALLRVCTNLIAVCEGAIYICVIPLQQWKLYKAFIDAGGHWPSFVIWDTHRSTPGAFDYRQQYVPILYGRAAPGERYWAGGKNQGDVWSIPLPMADRKHPAMQPVALVERAIQNSSRRWGTVLDPFAGSGTTLIACHRQNRSARLIEIDPLLVDVICRRWQQHTKNGVVLEDDGRTFEEITHERQQAA